ncbi:MULTISPECIES: glycerophosphodiester phosphodiesterase [Streptomyces]|jgi:Glycerophosphoryl diester phosphodiesterase|uniref:Glycerophosphoryl diester phosphodiesterase n=1 Tax=Streptomyces fradiae ATCC 10745 = DSM 40063 TaxID=1319510 RepID=A0A1Y2NY16_STRFR|nr:MULTISPECIES: glycerophosphodiester phosphodiesterase [Streptomyces]KAF0648906.1 glycerophosphoryl diester phosphodiesterase [Streptomyces fradiae ATCC 10745 = DSM 40063]OSY51899.1 Glycerophosphoryl diester phosphodiesterase [Streptomyces fradiae ATCC 10745 = DSM 40063]QEV14307.1 glycerophosphodiester phosphodiesterase [Streptomyces fradiae ATCC 10745 = DSM 40063]UQS30457.1 glycerophosphodiester phosphodiesterase [Streptomyces fradiae]
MRTVTVVGHRGDPYRVRENTLGSIRSALARGADAVEIDVRLTWDGVPVLLHDDTLRRLWRVDRPLASLSLAEVRELTGPEGVPTLHEALTAAAPHRVMIDLPGATEQSVRAVVGAVRECDAEDRVYYCSGAPAMLLVRAADPAAEIALTWTTLAPARPVLIDAVAPRWLNYRFGLVSAALADRVHRDGLLVAAWTADTRRSMRKLIGNGVDSITTNRVDTLNSVLTGART